MLVLKNGEVGNAVPVTLAEKKPKKSAGKFSYDDWYQKNKQRLSEIKAKKYRENKDYREAALQRSRDKRKNAAPVNLGEHTVSLKDAADQLQISIWTVREWRKKKYFPEPVLQLGKLFFKPSQVELLGKLKGFFDANGVRTQESSRAALMALVAEISQQW